MNHSPSNNVVVSAMISQERDIALIDELRGADAETACVEFKQNNAEHKTPTGSGFYARHYPTPPE